jgi:DNA-binding MurR/RpiR family transcriptional regulator
MGLVTGRVADFILAHPQKVMTLSLAELATAVTASEGLIIRLCQQVGVSGLQQLKISIGQDLALPAQDIQEDLRVGDSLSAVVEKRFRANIQALQDTLAVLKTDALQQAVDILTTATKIELYGIGGSAPVVQDAHYRFMRIGLNSRLTSDSILQAASACLSEPNTAVLAVSQSGSTREMLAALRLAKAAGARTVCITGLQRSPIHKYADVVLQSVAKDTRFRGEAMTSRTPQLAIVDALVAAIALSRPDHAEATIQRTFEVLSEKRF